MRVIVDVMSGDNAPAELIKGVASASQYCDADFLLVGNKERIRQIAAEHALDNGRFELYDAPTVVRMEDDPLTALRQKKDSSLVTGLRLLSEEAGDAFVSAGNTGALFSGATLIVKRDAGVNRAAIGTLLPGVKPCLLLDAGANVTVTSTYLEDFARIGSDYMKNRFGLAEPTVGLLNNGTEDCKGTPLQIEANQRLSACDRIRYVGNVEGNAAFFGACDVLVTDGFTGNVFLKSAEGIGKLLLSSLKSAYAKNPLTKLSALAVKDSISDLKKKFDPAEHGGSPILGIRKPVVKAHGSSDARAFRNAVLESIRFAESTRERHG